MILRLLPAILSLLVLAAHFLRIGNLPVVLLLLACIALLGVRRPWAAYTVQAILGVGVIVWLLTMSGIAAIRIQNGEPWLRMAAILGAVTVYCVYAVWHFRHPRLRAWFGTDREDIQDEADPSRL